MDKIRDASQKVFEEIMSMTEEELRGELEKHKKGDIATALLESGALSKKFIVDIAKEWIDYELSKQLILEFDQDYLKSIKRAFVEYTSTHDDHLSIWQSKECKVEGVKRSTKRQIQFSKVNTTPRSFSYKTAA